MRVGGRNAEYVDTVIKTYKEALESIEKGEYTEENIAKWRKQLGTEFNRGQSDGLYRGLKFAEWAGSHGSKATKEKTSIGKVTNFFKKIGVVEVTIKAKEEINLGEEYLITGETTGAVRGVIEDWKVYDVGAGLVPDQREKEIKTDTANQGQIITFKADGEVRRNDDMFVVRKRKSLIPRGRERMLAN